jgi:hypothetical protein
MDKPTNQQTVEPPSVEELFQRLPPLGSDDYLQHIRTASTRLLPGEVLARAFRQLLSETAAARATLERLLGKVGQRWEYLGPIAARARRRAKAQQTRNRADEDRDLLQDAIVRICSVLPTARGELAERAWNVFCRNAFEDAWRKRYGRRGEKLPWIREDLDSSLAEADGDDPIDRLSNDESPWRVIWEHEQSERIEAIVASVTNSLLDPFVQEVARAALGSSRRPKTSGTDAVDRDPPLTARFPGRSRHQINRALRHVDSRLAAALLAEPSLDWSNDIVAFLQQQESRGRRS